MRQRKYSNACTNYYSLLCRMQTSQRQSVYSGRQRRQSRCCTSSARLGSAVVERPLITSGRSGHASSEPTDDADGDPGGSGGAAAAPSADAMPAAVGGATVAAVIGVRAIRALCSALSDATP